MLDVWREAGRHLSVAHQMLLAPVNSLPRRVADAALKEAESAALSSHPAQGLFARALLILRNIDGEAADLRKYSRRGLAKAVHRGAETEWKIRVAASSRLRDSYSAAHTLKRRGYLSIDFPGRQVLLKLRVDDLALGASRWVAERTTLPVCELCRRGPETRQHFVLACRSLQHVRVR